ncbi:MAG TPA: CDP-alcohol phosphatidyltransferase family protein [Chthoniobacterales bacterium]|nr:CDP-alcohol phosphatidyltransferase family protein [Chthoniobacterales bacterium]
MQNLTDPSPDARPGQDDRALDRRPIKTRSARLVQTLALVLTRLGVSPNQVSVLSVVSASIGAALLVWEALGARTPWPLVGTAACIQLRLLANLVDGLIAVEGGRQTKIGELFNEFPDRIADVLLLAAAGYAAHHGEFGVAIGWIAAVLAVGTAYIRAFGARRGYPQDFCGPQAKQQRMFLLTLACLLGAGEKSLQMPPQSIFAFLIIIGLGTLITCVRRTIRLARQLKVT